MSEVIVGRKSALLESLKTMRSHLDHFQGRVDYYKRVIAHIESELRFIDDESQLGKERQAALEEAERIAREEGRYG